MNFFTRQGRTLLMAVALAVSAFVWTAAAQTEAAQTAGTFTDSRDGKKYKTVKIGDMTWMAQNLNYQTGKSWCYGGNNSNCAKYGRLYDWNTAKTACPKGWHLPSLQEWYALSGEVGDFTTAGNVLKSTSGWDDYKGKTGNGTDALGFSALPGGIRSPGGSFSGVGKYGTWWTADGLGNGYAYILRMNYQNGYAGDDESEPGASTSQGFSVRCVAD